ncbi:MAG: urea transporter [Ruminococcaceae bacterium]|nr:urea transporter [Oscillospiraceae bacterium]
MWLACFLLSIGCLVLSIVSSAAINSNRIIKKYKINLFNLLFASVFIATVFMFFPTHSAFAEETLSGEWRAFLLSVFNSMQVFTIGCEFSIVTDSMIFCPDWLDAIYQSWAATLFVLAPIFTFGFVLSLFKNLSAYLKYLIAYFKQVYVFSELNEKSFVLAKDIKTNNRKAVIVFTDVFEGNEETIYELVEEAKKLGAICFKKDIVVVDFKKHSPSKAIYFFAIGGNETENLNHSLKLIEKYNQRENTHIYVFSTKIESELLLTSVDKGKVRVRRVNEVQSLVNRVLYEHGEIIFESAKDANDNNKKISAVVVGMGRHGTEMVKALSWFGQMNGYSLEINAFDKDPLAEEKFISLAPELMSPSYNGVKVEGEAQYKITVHPDIDVDTITFADAIMKLKDATYVMVSLGNDDVNITTAIKLRMYFERMKIRPVIQAIVYNSQQKKALQGIKNYRGQEYGIEFIGDIESSYTEQVIIDSELENDALRRHLKWGKEEEFWTYEYNYRSSMASAIHMRARIKCGIPGATKKEEELTEQERNIIEVLEHRRWNAYMRAEGYVFSGSKEKSSRNDLAKMHHDLVDFSSLTEEEKRKDSRVGTN